MSLFKFGFTGEKPKEPKVIKGREETKRAYEAEKRQRKFYMRWKEEFQWVDYDEEKDVMFCISCRKYENSSVDKGRFVTGTSNFRIDALKQHNVSVSHVTNQRKYDLYIAKQNSQTAHCSYTGEITSTSSQLTADCQLPVVGPLDVSFQKLNESQQKQLISCFNTVYFVIKHELPFTLYPNLIDLQIRNGVELPESYKTDQACRRFVPFIFKDIMNDNMNTLMNANVLSVMFDGATDVSICENELVYARFLVDGIPKNVYIKNQDIEHAHAVGVKTAIEKAMDSASLDGQGWDWKSKLIATGSDGASVNIGKCHSVAALLKKEVPHLVSVHCVCHRLELAALDAMNEKESKLFLDLKSVLNNLHKHYHYSAKASRELQMLADAMEEKMLKPVNLEGTRWMPHLNRSLEVLLKKYSVFLAHFENTKATRKGSADLQARANLILKHLKDRRLLHFMHFLLDVMKILSDLSLHFQKDGNTLPDAVLALESAYLQLVALQQRPGRNLQDFLDNVNDENLFKGIKLSPLTLTDDQIKNKQNSLIDSVLTHLTKRVGDIDSNELMKDMQVLYPSNLPTDINERAVYGEKQIHALCEYFSTPLNRMGADIDHLLYTEWSALKAHMHQHGHGVSTEIFFQRLFTEQYLKVIFKNILMLLEIVLCIPISSAVCERGFSAMSRIKSDWRARLNPEMLNYLMAISLTGPTPIEYNAQRAFAYWWHGGDRTRRPEFSD